MKFLALIVFSALLISNIFGSNFYIAENGNDENSGLSADSPWQSINRLNQAANEGIFRNGDSILFRCNDIFTGSLTFEFENYIFSSYGNGEKPVLTGSVAVTGWTSLGNNIWRAAFNPQGVVRFLFVDDIAQPIGRFPDTGWLYCDAANGRNQITDNDLGISANVFQGGQCVVRSKRWIIDALEITSNTSTQINFEDASYGIAANSGYFIQNHPATLNFQGEWSFNEGYLYLYSTTNPASLSVKAPYYITFGNFKHSFGLIQKLSFVGYAHYGIECEWECHDITIRNCDFNYAGADGIKMAYITSNLALTGNTIRNSYNLGLNILYCNNVSISDNYIENSGMAAGLGNNGNNTYYGIYLEGGSNHLVTKNSIINSGYSAIVFNKVPAVKIINNFIDGACLLKDDGGGIYSHSQEFNSYENLHVLRGNVVRNVMGNIDGSNESGDLLGHGIYLDDYTSGVLAEDNILTDNTKAFYIHNAKDIIFRENLIADNGDGFYMNRNSSIDVVNNKIFKNTFLSTTEQGIIEEVPYNLHNYCIRVRSNLDLLSAATNNEFDSNIYCIPFYDDDYIAIDCPDDRTGRYNIDEFRSNTNHEEHSLKVPYQWNADMEIPREDFVLFDYSTGDTKLLNFNGYYFTPESELKYNQIEIPAYKYVILFKEDLSIVTGLKPEGEMLICDVEEPRLYALPTQDQNFEWELFPTEAGEIIPNNDTSVYIQWAENFSGQALIRVKFCLQEDICESVSEPLEVNINSILKADFTYTIEGQTATFLNRSTPFSEVLWIFGDGHTSNDVSPIHTYDNPGAFDVTLVIMTENCGNDTVRQQLIIAGTSVYDSIHHNLTIFPNPANNTITVYNIPGENPSGILKFYDSFGRLVLEQHISVGIHIDISDLPAGLYLIRYADEERKADATLVKLNPN